MSILTPEYAVRYMDDDGSILQHLGPYSTVALAERHAFGERKGWIIVERAVTKWDPVED
jgi:hypothetical protein